MLTLTVGAAEVYNEETGEFESQGGIELQLEHSLASLSKWESKYEKPFLGNGEKTQKEVFDYIRCMAIGENPPGDFLEKLSKANFDEINAYIDRKMTATWFVEQPGGSRNSEAITSELIYYWMTVFQIPFTCETWHLNRLFTLIRICNVKQGKQKKMSRTEVAQRNRQLNAQRKSQLGTTG